MEFICPLIYLLRLRPLALVDVEDVQALDRRECRRVLGTEYHAVSHHIRKNMVRSRRELFISLFSVAGVIPVISAHTVCGFTM